MDLRTRRYKIYFCFSFLILCSCAYTDQGKPAAAITTTLSDSIREDIENRPWLRQRFIHS